jgi:N6-L-threonylcarbamoyladenine synthase
MLGLPYPGGRRVEALAREAVAGDLRFSRPMTRRDQRLGDDDFYDVSFSGLKTAVLHAVRDANLTSPPDDGIDAQRAVRASIAAAFQDALVDALAEKTYRAAQTYRRTRVVLGGGVACNRTLAERVEERVTSLGARVFAPSPRLATDNAAMIARAGLFRLERGDTASLDLNAYASLPIPGLAAA